MRLDFDVTVTARRLKETHTARSFEPVHRPRTLQVAQRFLVPNRFHKASTVTESWEPRYCERKVGLYQTQGSDTDFGCTVDKSAEHLFPVGAEESQIEFGRRPDRSNFAKSMVYCQGARQIESEQSCWLSKVLVSTVAGQDTAADIAKQDNCNIDRVDIDWVSRQAGARDLFE